MKRRVKRFDGVEGSQVFSEAQEKWLRGADRTDPFILARMRSAVPDESKAEPKIESKSTVIESSEETGNKGTAVETTKPVVTKRPIAAKTETKPVAAKVEAKENKVTKTSSKSEDGENKEMVEQAYRDAAKLNPVKLTAEPESAWKKFRKALGSNYNSGGAVKRSSASKRGDGIATKGHTRGKYC